MTKFSEVRERLGHFIPDKPFIYLFFYKYTHRILRLKNPVKFTDKIQWLKLNGDLEKYSPYVDKFSVRSYIKAKVGSKYLVPLLGVWDSFDEIPFDKLPKRFVLKATHGCGYNYVCRDKSKIDYEKLKSTFDRWMSENFYEYGREPQYKPCIPKIVCEEYLEDESGGLCDIKFFCTNGIPSVIQLDTDRFIDHKSDLLDTKWNKLDYVSVGSFSGSYGKVKKPRNLEAMVDLARELSADFPFVRVDLYSVNNKIYFGELTFTPGSGIIDITPDSGDTELGKLIDLSSYSAALS